MKLQLPQVDQNWSFANISEIIQKVDYSDGLLYQFFRGVNTCSHLNSTFRDMMDVGYKKII